MASPSSNKRRNVVSPKSAEKNALNLIAEEADSREAKSQEVLSEARKIRCSERKKEMDVQEMEDGESPDQNGHNPLQKPAQAVVRNNSTERNNSLAHAQSPSPEDIHERFKRVMLVNAQLDNESCMLRYQTDLLKDQLETAHEAGIQLKEKVRRTQHDKSRTEMDLKDVQYHLDQVQCLMRQKDLLIKEHGFSMVTVDSSLSNGTSANVAESSSAFLSASQLDILSEYTGNLGNRLQQLFEEKNATLVKNKKLQRELDEARATIISTPNPPSSSSSSSSPNLLGDNANPLDNSHNQLIETKYKLKKAEQEITTLQGSVTRLETQLSRYKTSSESLEKAEEELKVDKRKLQIELRECKELMEELQTKNNHLHKRVEKMKVNRIQEALQ